MDPLAASDPERVGSYRLLARLGAGGMGRVYLGHREDGPAAVKVIRPEAAADPQFRSRFAREVALAKRVSGPYTAAVIDADAQAEQPWLAAELVHGPALHTAVQRNGALPEAPLAMLASGLARALQAIHDAGIIHRDLTPHNVLLDSHGPRVIDFGIAKALRRTTTVWPTSTGAGMGTPHYMSPEQVDDRDLSAKSDVFALGAVVYYAATGTHAFDAKDFRSVFYRVLATHPPMEGVPEPLRQVVAKALAKDPTDRPSPRELLALLPEYADRAADAWPPASAEDLVNTVRVEIRTLVATRVETGRVQVPTTRPQPPAADERRGRGGFWISAVLVIALVAGLVWVVGQNQPSELLRRDDYGQVVRFSADGARYTTRGPDSAVEIRETESGEAAAVLPVSELGGGDLGVLALSPDGTAVALRSGDEVLLWDSTAGDGSDSLTALPYDSEESDPNAARYPVSAAISPDHSVLALGGGDELQLWEPGAAEPIAGLVSEDISRSRSGVFSPDGTLVASAGGLDPVALWDAASGAQHAVLSGRQAARVRALAFSPDSATLAAGGGDGLALWDADTGEHRTTLLEYEAIGNNVPGLHGRATGLAFSPDGTRLASGHHECRLRWYHDILGERRCAGEGLVIVWDVPNGRRIATLDHDDEELREVREDEYWTGSSALDNPVYSLGFLDNDRLATADRLGSLVLWEVP